MGSKKGDKGSLVQKYTAEGLVEVLAETGDCFFENVQRGAAFLSIGLLIDKVVIQDLVDRVGVWKRYHLIVFGDILPIVDENRLEMIWQRNLNRRPVVEIILLWLISIVLPIGR